MLWLLVLDVGVDNAAMIWDAEDDDEIAARGCGGCRCELFNDEESKVPL